MKHNTNFTLVWEGLAGRRESPSTIATMNCYKNQSSTSQGVGMTLMRFMVCFPFKPAPLDRPSTSLASLLHCLSKRKLGMKTTRRDPKNTPWIALSKQENETLAQRRLHACNEQTYMPSFLNDRHITHLNCVCLRHLLYDFLGGGFAPIIYEK